MNIKAVLICGVASAIVGALVLAVHEPVTASYVGAFVTGVVLNLCGMRILR